MNQVRPHIEDSELLRLLYEPEDSVELRQTAVHVETCDECERRLAELAASDEFVVQANAMLSNYPPGESSNDASTDKNERCLDFLSPPSHPEMLGRLGRYEIERVIGSGGMGVVLKGFDTELNRPVAIKVLAQHLRHSGAARQRFAREAKAAAAVVHEHMVAIHNVEADREVPFLVMQFVAGESLQARVDREGPLDPKEVLRIGIQAASGLAAAHQQGVVNRDVKPANILLENGVERVLLTDFGLARTVDDASLTHTGVVAGTPHYMSPEQANGDATDHRTDLFSLGSVLYFMATGHPPFRAERAMGVLHRICHEPHRPVWQVNGDIPDELSEIIDRLLEKKPSSRFASASVVQQSLSRLLSRWQQHGLSRRRRRSRRKQQVMRLVSVIAIVTVCAAFFTSLMMTDSQLETAAPTGSEESVQAEQLDDQLNPQAYNANEAAVVEKFRVLDQQLNQLEAMSDASVFSQSNSDGFDQRIEVYDGLLDTLNGDIFPNLSSPQQNGDQP